MVVLMPASAAQRAIITLHGLLMHPGWAQRGAPVSCAISVYAMLGSSFRVLLCVADMSQSKAHHWPVAHQQSPLLGLMPSSCRQCGEAVACWPVHGSGCCLDSVLQPAKQLTESDHGLCTSENDVQLTCMWLTARSHSHPSACNLPHSPPAACQPWCAVPARAHLGTLA